MRLDKHPPAKHNCSSPGENGTSSRWLCGSPPTCWASCRTPIQMPSMGHSILLNSLKPSRDKQLAGLQFLQETIERAAHLLPAQGPITRFVHHNTLHAFEDLPFHEAVTKAADLFGCQPYLSEDRYRQELGRGRIRFTTLEKIVEEDLGARAGEMLLGLCTRRDLWLAMLEYPLRTGPTEELPWFVAEKDALRRIRSDTSSAVRAQLIAETRRWVMRDLRGRNETRAVGPTKKVGRFSTRLTGLFERFRESAIESWSERTWEEFTLQALWQVCCEGVSGVASFRPQSPEPLRHRDLLLQATGADADLLVHDLLIRFCAAFLDQGLARWPLPRREEGFYQAFCALYRQAGGPPSAWMRGLAEELARLQEKPVRPLESLCESLEVLGVAEEEWERFLAATLLALRGWAGMIHQLERQSYRVVRPIPADSLVDYLAIRLVVDRFALAYTAREALGYRGSLRELRRELRDCLGEPPPPSVEQRAFLVFQLAQVLGWAAPDLHRLHQGEWAKLLEEIESFSGMERRRIFQLAYERRFTKRALDAVALHSRQPAPSPLRPRFQAIFCLDEREESFRRHLEELAPEAVTFGTAGFFSVAMYYRGAGEADFTPLCPGSIRPQHWVIEQVAEDGEKTGQRWAKRRRVLGLASYLLHLGSRTFGLAALQATVLGVLASVPLIARTWFPRWTARFRKKVGRLGQRPPVGRLLLERSEPAPGPANGQVGFNFDEMAAIGEKVLREIGLTSGFARLVLLLGHGSTSLNNPHESAHDCGACGGACGGPNARALAQMLNDPRVRERLKERGHPVPAKTVFVGGWHNTSSDAVTFFDLDRLSEAHQKEFDAVRAVLEQARERDAHERCRRFASAPLTLSYEAARQHVEGRAEDLAQVRPEWGHASNALSLIGRRQWSRGLFLDRRAFLTSYDPAQDDPEHTLLEQILQAVFPVCAGIALEYYFSYVDNSGYGCGTKLPHNITALLGVMDGAASDLRTGLPWQMVEIHEPIRLLNIIETTPGVLLRILDRNPDLARLCRNGWVQVAVLDAAAGQIQVYRDGRFHEYRPHAASLPKAPSSLDWYRGWRDHLEFAQIEPGS
jgi:uncharacterized protein YbcC (UPF0753/DUF2309 family)